MTWLSFAQRAFIFKYYTSRPLIALSLARVPSSTPSPPLYLSLYISFSRFLNPIVGISCENVLVPLVNLLFPFIVFHFIVTPTVWQNTHFEHATFDGLTTILSHYYYYRYYRYYHCSLMIKLNLAIQVSTYKYFCFMFISDGNAELRIWKMGTRPFLPLSWCWWGAFYF